MAGWADAGLHPETFWLGYAGITAAAWRPAPRTALESAAAFYKLFYGDGAVNMNRVYQLMSEQAQSWSDSWGGRAPQAHRAVRLFRRDLRPTQKAVRRIRRSRCRPLRSPDLKAAGAARKPPKESRSGRRMAIRCMPGACNWRRMRLIGQR